MYLAGVSVRRIEDITWALWAVRVSPGTVSELSKKFYSWLEAYRNRKKENSYPHIYPDGLCLKRNCGGEVKAYRGDSLGGKTVRECETFTGA